MVEYNASAPDFRRARYTVMPYYELPDETLFDTCEAVIRCKSQRLAAKDLGIVQSSLCDRLGEAERRGIYDRKNKAILKPRPLTGENKRVAELEAALKRAFRPVYTVRHDTATDERIRVVVIGDAHDDPKQPKDRFEWIGHYINQERPDVVIQIGDFANFDSLNTHVPNETFNGKAKPTFLADVGSLRLAIDAINSKLNYIPERHCTLGNHERRLYLFEDSAPEAHGMMSCEIDCTFRDRGWTYSPYGQIYMRGGVGFVHAALNRMGKTYGGKNAETTIANDAVFDLVIGHSHVERVYRAPKIGTGNEIQIMNVGCALPEGHVEEYAAHALTGWAWGIADIEIRGGHIKDRRFVTMTKLEELARGH